MTTHAHYAGEFGAQKMTKKLEKDPAYRAARAEHYANEANKANTEHAKLVNSGGSKAKIAEHALVAAHAEKRAKVHADAAQKLAPGSKHAANATAAYVSIHRDNSKTKEQKSSTAKNKNDPKYLLTKIQHYVDIARAAGVKHVFAKSASNTASAAFEVAHAVKKIASYTKTIAALAPNSATHAKALAAKSESEEIHSQTIKSKSKNIDNNRDESKDLVKSKFEFKKSDFNKAKNDFAKKITSVEHGAILRYSEEHYKSVNLALRKGTSKDGVTKEIIKHMDSALSKSTLNHKVVTYRGAINSKIYENMKPGDHYIEKGYSSTSASKKIANEFGASVLMHITIPSGNRAAVIPSTSPSEKEVLLPRNQKFRVDSVTKVDGRLEMHITVI